MKNKFFNTLFLWLMLVAQVPMHSVQASSDHMEARLLRDAGEIIPLEKLLNKVKKVVSGTVIEVELERKKQRIVYEIEILQPQGIVKKIYIDARTSEIISIEDDD